MKDKQPKIPNPIKKGKYYYISVPSVEAFIPEDEKMLRNLEEVVRLRAWKETTHKRRGVTYFRVKDLSGVIGEYKTPELYKMVPRIQEKISKAEKEKQRRETMTTKDIIPMEDDETVIPSKLYDFLKPKMSFEKWYKGLEERFPVEGMVTPEALKLPIAKSVVASTSIKLSKLLQKAHRNETKVIVEE